MRGGDALLPGLRDRLRPPFDDLFGAFLDVEREAALLLVAQHAREKHVLAGAREVGERRTHGVVLLPQRDQVLRMLLLNQHGLLVRHPDPVKRGPDEQQGEQHIDHHAPRRFQRGRARR